jgi:hypothetical protein
MRASEVAIVRYRPAAELRRARHAPARHDELALAVEAVANDRRHPPAPKQKGRVRRRPMQRGLAGRGFEG